MKSGGGPVTGPDGEAAHSIDAVGGTGEDLTRGPDHRVLRADARHLADVATELDNLANYFGRDLKESVDRIRSLTHPSAADGAKHYGGAKTGWTNPTGQFGDAHSLWDRYGQAATAAATFSERIHSAVSHLADGTRTIAARYTNTESRNDLVARQIEAFLTSGPDNTTDISTTTGTGAASSSGYAGGDPGTSTDPGTSSDIGTSSTTGTGSAGYVGGSSE